MAETLLKYLNSDILGNIVFFKKNIKMVEHWIDLGQQ